LLVILTHLIYIRRRLSSSRQSADRSNSWVYGDF